VLLFACGVFAAANIVLTWSAFDQAQNVYRSASDARILMGTGDTRGQVALASLIPASLLGLAFVAWIYQSYLNLPALDAERTLFTPVTAVLAGLVPLVNLVTTFFLLGELARESKPERLDPAAKSGDQSGAITLWWIILLFAHATNAGVIFLSYQATEPADLFLPLLMSMITSGLSIVDFVLLIYIVNSIYISQEERRQLVLYPPKPVTVMRVPEFPDEPRPQSAD
jgi:hypothetical protein